MIETKFFEYERHEEERQQRELFLEEMKESKAKEDEILQEFGDLLGVDSIQPLAEVVETPPEPVLSPLDPLVMLDGITTPIQNPDVQVSSDAQKSPHVIYKYAERELESMRQSGAINQDKLSKLIHMLM